MSRNPNGNWFVRFFRKAASLLGFHKTYNFPLWFIFGGALVGFCLARLEYLAIDTRFKDGSAPGEWFWFRRAPYRPAMIIHLATILPAGILAVFQFVPKIRHNFILIHKIDGYIIILAVLTTVGTALVMARRSFGGTVETQAGVYFLALITTVSLLMAYYNIKKKQIEQHRNWMLRMVVYMSSIITTRIIMIIAATIIGGVKSYFITLRCDELEFTDKDTYDAFYSTICKAQGPQSVVPVQAFWGDGMTTANACASLRLTFGMALWMAIVIHIVGVDIYLHLTPAETNRLRQSSYEKQLQRGMKNPGSAGLTSDRLGDAPKWEPEAKLPQHNNNNSDNDNVRVERRKTQDTDEEGGDVERGNFVNPAFEERA